MNQVPGLGWRIFVDRVIRWSCAVAVVAAIIPLGLVLWYVVRRGIGGVDLAFFTELPKPVGEQGGGMANAIVGSLELIGIASLFGIPPGVLAGLYLSEYREQRLAKALRFTADVMASVPSITVGLFVYALVVLRMKHFSAWAGGMALSILMLPVITRSTEELCKLVPDALREAALGLGVPRYRTSLQIVLRAALPGIVTGIMLAVARVAGETAPLLFTAFGNRFWSDSPNQPIAALPVQIYAYAVSPYDQWHRQAWAAALVLVVIVLVINLSARLLVRHRVRSP
jgi:phosphate transport system permease protein